MKRTLLILVVAIAAGAGGYYLATRIHQPPSASKPAPATPATSMIPFSLPDLNGKSRNIEEWKGKVIVLNFWATYCPPCREEIPVFMALQKQYGKDGLKVVGVAIDDLKEVREYRDSLHINYPLLIGGREAMGIMSDYGNLAGFLPYSVIMDRSGRIKAAKLGAYTRAKLEPLLKPLLATGHSG